VLVFRSRPRLGCARAETNAQNRRGRSSDSCQTSNLCGAEAATSAALVGAVFSLISRQTSPLLSACVAVSCSIRRSP
jgi:hypothetical protein